MPIMAVTRLRLRNPADLDAFFQAAVAIAEQANAAQGCLGERALADAANVFWTVSGWEDRPSMIALTQSEPHRANEARLGGWCDEATFAEWEQEVSALPDWQTGDDRLVALGRPAPLTHGAPANDTLDLPRPVEGPCGASGCPTTLSPESGRRAPR